MLKIINKNGVETNLRIDWHYRSSPSEKLQQVEKYRDDVDV